MIKQNNFGITFKIKIILKIPSIIFKIMKKVFIMEFTKKIFINIFIFISLMYL